MKRGPKYAANLKVWATAVCCRPMLSTAPPSRSVAENVLIHGLDNSERGASIRRLSALADASGAFFRTEDVSLGGRSLRWSRVPVNRGWRGSVSGTR